MARTIFVTLLIGVLAYAAFAMWRHDDMRRKFDSVYQGMTRAQVLELMGPPDIERSGCRDKPPSWPGQPVPDKHVPRSSSTRHP